jgi:hypothetical protein
MLFRETNAVYCENHTKHKDTLCGQNAEFQYVKGRLHIVTTEFEKVKGIHSKTFSEGRCEVYETYKHTLPFHWGKKRGVQEGRFNLYIYIYIYCSLSLCQS